MASAGAKLMEMERNDGSGIYFGSKADRTF